MFKKLANRIIEAAKKRPYRKGHIYNKDGSLYMGRYSFFETKWLSCRVHHIAAPDDGRAMHDHPWSFLSIVLRGWYIEERPLDPYHPVFLDTTMSESTHWTNRKAGSIAWRHACTRHWISTVSNEDFGGECWTLFIYGPLRQWWGFFTPRGKVYWQDYLKETGREGTTNG